MSLLKCAECGKEISQKAEACPNCGAPRKKEEPGCLVKMFSAFFGIIALLILIGLFTNLPKNSNDTTSTEKTEKKEQQEEPKLTPKEIECAKKAGPKPYQSAWDAEVRCVDKYLQNNLNDPDSLDYIEWSPVFPFGETWGVRVKFRAKNAFGGYVINEKIALIKNNEVVSFYDYKK